MTNDSARIERLAKIRNQPVPFIVRELSIDIDCARHANREAEERACRLHVVLDPADSLLHRFRGDTDFAANLVQLGEGQSGIRRRQAPARILRLSGILENLGYFFFAESALAHPIKVSQGIIDGKVLHLRGRTATSGR